MIRSLLKDDDMGRFCLMVVLCGWFSLAGHHEIAATERTSVALTFTVSERAPETVRKLTETLVTLVEVGILADDSLAVVERRQIELAFQELALSRTRTADESLQLGKLATADLLVMLELRRPDKESAKSAAFLRIVEAKTAAIRGVVAIADLDETNVEDAAEQFARYLTTVIREPQQPVVTVAVAPFESVGRFDRLRPLELGIRDLVTSRLLRLSNALRRPLDSGRIGRAEGRQPPDNSDRPQSVRGLTPAGSRAPSQFQVLQRSSLEHLQRELDLVQSGFADKDRLPRTMPDREAAFLIKGEIDERQVDGQFMIVVRGELRHAASAKVHASFEFECPPVELESQLGSRVDDLAKHLGLFNRNAIGVRGGDAGSPAHADGVGVKQLVVTEADSLKRLALNDLHRFRRISPTDFGHRAFAMPGEPSLRDIPRLIKAETPLGQALLRKTIDRLETSLFIHPDDAETSYALGFCFSIHQPEIYRPARADELLRHAAAKQPQTELAALALAILSELDFDDRSGQFAPAIKGSDSTAESWQAARDAAAERIWLAFEKTPARYRDHRWPRILDLVSRVQRTPEQNATLLEKAIPFAEQADDKHRRQLAGAVQVLAIRLANQSSDKPAMKAKAIDMLQCWAEGSDAQLADAGRLGLVAISATNRDFLGAAILLEESAANLANATSAQDRHKHDVQLVNAAKNYRLAKQPDRALRLLKSFEPTTKLISNLVGMHGYELGACLEDLKEPKQALAAYLRAAERCPGIVPNSDLVQRVVALGGVPLREDRTIDVEYIAPDSNTPGTCSSLATDGQRLYVGGTGVSVFDPETQTWRSLKPGLRSVVAMKIRDRELWVATNGSGLWRCDLRGGQWTPFGTEQGLPDQHVVSLAMHGDDVYAGVGSLAAGGLVRIDKSGMIHTLSESDAPRVAPTHIVADDKRLLVRTAETIHEWSFDSTTWTLHKADPKLRPSITSRLFAGNTNVWASNYGRELTIWEADEPSNELFKPAWYFAPGTKAGYRVDFVAERNDEVWFGGSQWDSFISSGLYCIHRKTGEFRKFTPADGFMTVTAHSIHDGLWLNDRLWLTTSSGLCVVTPRK